MKRFTWVLKVLSLGVAVLLSHSLYAQQEEEVDLFEMSLEDLMNVEIVSASKKEESAFDAPISSSVITRDEIARSGVTTIPEALRLSPGLIVREVTNGNYEVFIRGFENLPRFGPPTEHGNLYTLVMIDNRPVFKYNTGGVYWESLPVDLVDIERIEIVRGPSAPLFGPNAVTGVINIITHRSKKAGLYASGNLQYGTPDTKVANAAVGGSIGERWNVIVSGNYQERARHDEQYYDFVTDEFAETPSTEGIRDMSQAYPDTELAMEKYGVNAFIEYQANDDVRLDLSVGTQDAASQRYNNGRQNPLSYTYANSRYVNLAGKIHGLSTRLSYTKGNDDIAPGVGYVAEFDFNIIDAVVDYQWNITDRLSLRPSVNYQSATYDDTEYTQVLNGLYSGSATVGNIAGSLRSDYMVTDQWRVVGGVRFDKFSYPDNTYLSYQFASTYKLNNKYLFRAAHSRSNSGGFLNNSLNFEFQEEIIPGAGIFLTSRLNGNPDLKFSTVTMSEVGFRGQLTKNLQVDVELFRQRIRDVSTIVVTNLTTQQIGPNPEDVVPDVVQSNFVNLPLTAVQNGITLSVNYVPDARLQLRPFITVQRTEVEDLSLGLSLFPLDPRYPVDINSTIDTEHNTTPLIFGGAYVNFAVTSRLNVNASTYFFGKHTMYAAADQNPTRVTKVNNISSKVLVNTKVSYRLVDKLRVFGTVKNALGNDSREHYGTDRIGRSLFFGASYNF